MKKNICLYIGLLIIIYSACTTFLRNKIISFNMETLILGIIFILYGMIKDKLKEWINKSRFKNSIRNILYLLITLSCAGFIIIEGMIILYPKHNLDKSDCIIVLGAGVEGEKPSLSLKYRLDKAIESYEDGMFIVVSGGQGNDEKYPESYVMKNYLINNGINEDSIIEENRSKSTFENFKYSKEKIEKYCNNDIKDVKVKIITTDFHAMRSSMLAKRNGYNNITVNSCENVWYLTPYMYTREAIAYLKSYILDK